MNNDRSTLDFHPLVIGILFIGMVVLVATTLPLAFNIISVLVTGSYYGHRLGC